ncbi:ATPase-AAA-core domain-containing protein [Mycena kentingensis (nom. inval.)]|nr:ATPase-AAA-core domain-containing protein [Mycena kentingensis (nom. inval.)]
MNRIRQLFGVGSDASTETGDDLRSWDVDAGDSSTASLSVLPSEPKLFFGRDTEVEFLVRLIASSSAPTAAILGTGGIGKTSLARAVLHHPTVTTRYSGLGKERRLFIPCDRAHNAVDVLTLCGLHLEVDVHAGSVKTRVLNALAARADEGCLVFLDNLETCWEPENTRGRGRGAIVAVWRDYRITMRGAERPAKTQWTRPFLPPLSPLTTEAATETFLAITDNVDSEIPGQLDELLQLTDNIPLAVDLLANLVDIEGCAPVLASWATHKTSLVSAGRDPRSNLDISISLSLASPRMKASPNALALLSVLSILPDGLAEADLLHSDLPLDDILACRQTLLRTSLAYVDTQSARLKVLVPIREYVQAAHPPPRATTRLLGRQFFALLQMCKRFYGRAETPFVSRRVATNLGNLRSVFGLLLEGGEADLRDGVAGCLDLNQLSCIMGYGSHQPTMKRVAEVFARDSSEPGLYAKFAAQVLLGSMYGMNFFGGDLDELVRDVEEQHLVYLESTEDHALESTYYCNLGEYYRLRKGDVQQGILCFLKAAAVADAAGSQRHQRRGAALGRLALGYWQTGDYRASRDTARAALAQFSRGTEHESLLESAQALRVEGMALSNLGDFAADIRCSQRATELLARCGMSDAELSYRILNNESELRWMQTDYVEGRKVNERILASPFAVNRAFAWLNLALIDVEDGSEEERVRADLANARQLFVPLGYARGLNFCDLVDAKLDLRERRWAPAKSGLEKALRGNLAKDGEIVSDTLEKLGDISLWEEEHDADWVYAYAVVFLANGVKMQSHRQTLVAMTFLGELHFAKGDKTTAKSLFSAALDGLSRLDVHRYRANCLKRLGDLAEDRERSRVLWEQARNLYERTMQKEAVKGVVRRLESLQFPLGIQ